MATANRSRNDDAHDDNDLRSEFYGFSAYPGGWDYITPKPCRNDFCFSTAHKLSPNGFCCRCEMTDQGNVMREMKLAGEDQKDIDFAQAGLTFWIERYITEAA